MGFFKVEVYCNACGFAMDASLEAVHGSNHPQLQVEPCEHCIAEAEKAGQAVGVKRTMQAILEGVKNLGEVEDAR